MTKPRPTGNAPLIPAVGYIRMSTDNQKESPERQRSEINALAARDGYQILRWYEDHGLTGTESKNRPEFQKMMTDVPAGEFRAILLYEQSRFSREGVFDVIAHWKILQAADVKLISVQSGEMRFDDLGDLIKAIVGQHGARTESVQLAHRVLSGRRQKAHTGAHTARAPFGFAREILDETGTVVKRVGPNERFRRPKTWTSRLVLSDDPEVVAAVRYMFDAVTKGVTTRQIALELNRRGMKTIWNYPFNRHSLRPMLSNPAYMGSLHFGKVPRGKFAKCSDLIVVPNAHDPIISPGLFEEVQSILGATQNLRGFCTPGKYPLTGVLFCGRCGRRMTGWSSGEARRYTCQQVEFNHCRPAPTVDADAIEGMILRMIVDRVLCEANREKIEEAVDRLRTAKAEGPSTVDGQLTELRANIARAETNLALADGDNFDAIAKRLNDWRAQEKKLKATQRNKRQKDRPALSSADDLQLLRDNLLADPVALAVALKRTVKRVTVNRQLLPKQFPTDLEVRFIHGTVEFFPEIFPDVLTYSDADLYHEQALKLIADYVTRAGRQVRSTELGEMLSIPKEVALNRAKRAVRLGLIGFQRKGNLYMFKPLDAATSGV